MGHFVVSDPDTPVTLRMLLSTEVTLRGELVELRAEIAALRAKFGDVLC